MLIKKILVASGIIAIAMIFFFTYRWFEPTFNVPDVDNYTACGCGCCGGTEHKTVCLYHSDKDDIKDIIIEDRRNARSPDCPQAGCSLPTLFKYCD